MLDYVRIHGPDIVILENVDTPEVTSAYTALLRGIREYSYDVDSYVSDASESGDMDRRRRFWVAVRIA